ncbi:solute carrier family 35 member F4-like isoform X2 [Glandiceps talaboti]
MSKLAIHSEDYVNDEESYGKDETEHTDYTIETSGSDNRCMSDNVRKTIIGLLIVIGIAISWVGSTQFTQSTYSEKFDAPFFVVWFSTIWMSVCYPGYFLPTFAFGRNRGHAKVIFSENESVFGTHGLCCLTFFKYVGPFCVCWAATNYMYVYALGNISAADVTALFSSNTAFIYLLSWVVLNEKFVPLKVFFKRVVGDASLGQVSLFLTLLSIFNLLFLWPVMLVLRLTGVENWEWKDMPWDYICGSAALGVAFNFLINFGIAYTYPLYIAIGTVLGIPLNAVVDYIWRNTPYGVIKIVGTLLIIGGFVLMILPSSWHDKVRWPCTTTPAEELSDVEAERKPLLTNKTEER